MEMMKIISFFIWKEGNRWKKFNIYSERMKNMNKLVDGKIENLIYEVRGK